MNLAHPVPRLPAVAGERLKARSSAPRHGRVTPAIPLVCFHLPRVRMARRPRRGVAFGLEAGVSGDSVHRCFAEPTHSRMLLGASIPVCATR